VKFFLRKKEEGVKKKKKKKGVLFFSWDSRGTLTVLQFKIALLCKIYQYILGVQGRKLREHLQGNA
jgi:hypothetical protein